MERAEILKREIRALAFDQYGTIVDMQKGLTEAVTPFLKRKGCDGKEVHTESPRVLLPGYYRAGNTGADCCQQIRSTPRLTARRPHREISHPLVMALAFPRLALPRTHRGVRSIHDLVRSPRDNVRRRQCDRFSSALDNLGIPPKRRPCA